MNVPTAILMCACTTISSILAYQCGQFQPPKERLVLLHSELPLPPDVPLTLAVLNKNPLNVKGTGWKGQIGTDARGFAIFERWEYGVRAASFVLKNYAKKHKLSTLRGIVCRFSDTDQEEYMTFLGRKLNLDVDETFDVVRRLPELLRHMSRFEAGATLPEQLFIPYDVLEFI